MVELFPMSCLSSYSLGGTSLPLGLGALGRRGSGGNGRPLPLCVILHVLGGLAAYFGCKPLGYNEQTCAVIPSH